mmetsp:Transcript_21959/g.62346  ORF Transcript_21959/g.62346 Transcript_21959/m.62346 type:complete len:634 (-) Transcript_21959:64-1965(-)
MLAEGLASTEELRVKVRELLDGGLLQRRRFRNIGARYGLPARDLRGHRRRLRGRRLHLLLLGGQAELPLQHLRLGPALQDLRRHAIELLPEHVPFVLQGRRLVLRRCDLRLDGTRLAPQESRFHENLNNGKPERAFVDLLGLREKEYRPRVVQRAPVGEKLNHGNHVDAHQEHRKRACQPGCEDCRPSATEQRACIRLQGGVEHRHARQECVQDDEEECPEGRGHPEHRADADDEAPHGASQAILDDEGVLDADTEDEEQLAHVVHVDFCAAPGFLYPVLHAVELLQDLPLAPDDVSCAHRVRDNQRGRQARLHEDPRPDGGHRAKGQCVPIRVDGPTAHAERWKQDDANLDDVENERDVEHHRREQAGEQHRGWRDAGGRGDPGVEEEHELLRARLLEQDRDDAQGLVPNEFDGAPRESLDALSDMALRLVRLGQLGTDLLCGTLRDQLEQPLEVDCVAILGGARRGLRLVARGAIGVLVAVLTASRLRHPTLGIFTDLLRGFLVARDPSENEVAAADDGQQGQPTEEVVQHPIRALFRIGAVEAVDGGHRSLPAALVSPGSDQMVVRHRAGGAGHHRMRQAAGSVPGSGLRECRRRGGSRGGNPRHGDGAHAVGVSRDSIAAHGGPRQKQE